MAQAVCISADVVDSDWLDEMVKKLKSELEAQLARVTTGTRMKRDAAALAADARDRMDALVWALADLFGAPVREPKIRPV